MTLGYGALSSSAGIGDVLTPETPRPCVPAWAVEMRPSERAGGTVARRSTSSRGLAVRVRWLGERVGPSLGSGCGLCEPDPRDADDQ
jgi:hypothetical protein